MTCLFYHTGQGVYTARMTQRERFVKLATNLESSNPIDWEALEQRTLLHGFSLQFLEQTYLHQLTRGDIASYSVGLKDEELLSSARDVYGYREKGNIFVGMVSGEEENREFYIPGILAFIRTQARLIQAHHRAEHVQT
ncbi:hypothetical protein C5B42_03290 [Candidatus Cerribacteria bacterium 'Amazon FNV 2010 28 9']|uniref:Uncharacterized protein n=1 Tax=Candidatus Cerribacteria bacterium 'Amazon FNV 2010 28 9' TaxID=2081795 RepID=A0A317JNP4_9BACT|nr:MAG: hypothetical protein C5B42_03290 [Candidatus Cerribacteria bacterium 'Amazon FNV 2010 28 9']